MQITVQTLIEAPITLVWSCYTTPEDIVVWNAASDDWCTTRATVDLRPGGTFSSRMEARDGSMGFDFAGTYTRIEPCTLIEARFGDRNMTVTFEDTAKGTGVRITFDAEETNPVDMQRAGWQAILDNFARHVAGKV